MTINELAKLAGVSKTTVSRVLNGKPDVSKATMDRINALIKDTDYTPNAFAKAINIKKSRTLCLVLPFTPSYIFSSMYYSDLLRGIYTHVDERSYYLMLCYPKNNNCSSFFKQHRVDGFIVITPSLRHTDIIDELREVDAPTILTSALPDCPYFPYADINEFEGTRQAIEHLIQLGHRRIAYIGEAFSACSLQREHAMKECLAKHSIVCNEAYIRLANDDLMMSGYEQTKVLMGLQTPPTAIFCSADTTAIGALSALHELKIRVPNEVSLIGFDDVFMCKYLDPPLTTVHQSAYMRGYTVTKAIIDFLEDETPMHNIILEQSLQIRSSTAKPPES